MTIEDPLQLLGRLKLGREEYCQRLLTMLILDDRYPPWNSRNRPCVKGAEFLHRLDCLCFGETTWPARQPLFVDEFELRKRHEGEAGAAPDYALLWDDRLWMIELKTETGSHRPTQLPVYLELAAHHYPDAAIHLTYLTPPMSLTAPPMRPGMRFRHLTWDQVIAMVQATWYDATASQRHVVSLLIAAVDSIGSSWAGWRAGRLAAPPGEPGERRPAASDRSESKSSVDPTAEAIALADATAHDGLQRAWDHPVSSLEELQQLRLTIRQVICGMPADASIRRVGPWIWNAATSGGRPLTPAGQETGYELRFSRYRASIC